jgi:hypothetical protein
MFGPRDPQTMAIDKAAFPPRLHMCLTVVRVRPIEHTQGGDTGRQEVGRGEHRRQVDLAQRERPTCSERAARERPAMARRYYDPSGRQHSRQFARRIDAQRWLDSVTIAVGTGGYVDPNRSKTNVGVVADQWLASKLNLKPTTRARYENALAVHVLPRWADAPLASVERGAVQAWLGELSATGQSGASVRKIHGELPAILDLAVRDKGIPANPANGVSLQRGESPLAAIPHRRRGRAARRRGITSSSHTSGVQASRRVPRVRSRGPGPGLLWLALVRASGASGRACRPASSAAQHLRSGHRDQRRRARLGHSEVP